MSFSYDNDYFSNSHQTLVILLILPAFLQQIIMVSVIILGDEECRTDARISDKEIKRC